MLRGGGGGGGGATRACEPEFNKLLLTFLEEQLSLSPEPVGEPSGPQCVRGDLPMTRGTFQTGLVPTRAAGGGRACVAEGGARRACGLGRSPG